MGFQMDFFSSSLSFSTPPTFGWVGVVAGEGWSGGMWRLEWWHVGVVVVASGGLSGGVRELEW